LIPLKDVKVGETILDHFGVLYGAEEELRTFLPNPIVTPITSYRNGKELYDSINKLTSGFSREDTKITWFEAQELSENLNKFEVALQADFGIRDTFIVSPKRAYSTNLLSEHGETMVSSLSSNRFKTIHQDLHDAGRCVAFELPRTYRD
jgi:hypothetical protein